MKILTWKDFLPFPLYLLILRGIFMKFIWKGIVLLTKICLCVCGSPVHLVGELTQLLCNVLCGRMAVPHPPLIDQCITELFSVRL